MVVLVVMAAALVVMMVLVVMAAAFVVMMMLVVTAAAFVVMVVLMAVAAAFMVMVMLLLLVLLGKALGLHLGQLICQGLFVLHGLHQLCASELIPGGGHHGGNRVVLPQEGHRSVQLLLADGIGPAENNGRRRLDLVVIELPKIAHIDLTFSSIGHSHRIAQLHLIIGNLFYSSNHIAELPHT